MISFPASSYIKPYLNSSFIFFSSEGARFWISTGNNFFFTLWKWYMLLIFIVGHTCIVWWTNLWQKDVSYHGSMDGLTSWLIDGMEWNGIKYTWTRNWVWCLLRGLSFFLHNNVNIAWARSCSFPISDEISLKLNFFGRRLLFSLFTLMNIRFFTSLVN